MFQHFSMFLREYFSLKANRQGPHRLVVRTSRCGRDNPGSTPGEDIAAWAAIIEGSEKYPGYPCGRAGQGMDSIALLLDRG